jgi:hypothetical protein
MKKSIFVLALITTVGLVTFSSCSSDAKEESNEGGTSVSTKEYYCPMECEGDKKYADEGKCPVCEMDLIKD